MHRILQKAQQIAECGPSNRDTNVLATVSVAQVGGTL
jgi:hypothetical protein